MLWLLICAGIFSAFEDWPLGLAFYFCFLTMSTNNLGKQSSKIYNQEIFLSTEDKKIFRAKISFIFQNFQNFDIFVQIFFNENQIQK